MSEEYSDRRIQELKKNMDLVEVLVVFTGSNHKVKMINRKGCELLGFPEAEIVGKDWFSTFLPEAARDHVTTRFEDLIRGKKQPEPYFVNPVVTKTGKERLILWHNTVLRDDRGDIVGLLSTGEDITEHKRVEKALEESEGRFRGLVEASSDWVWEVDNELRYTYTSPKVLEVMGYKPEEVLGKTPFDFMLPAEAKRVRDVLEPFISERKPFDMLENIILHKEGRVVVLETSGVPVFDAEGRYRGYRGIDRDVTARKRTEQALTASEARFRNVVESSPMGMHMYRLNPDGSLVFMVANPAADKILGIDHTPLIGKTIEEAFPHLAATEVPEKYRQVASKGISWYTDQITYNDTKPSGALEVYCFQTSPGRMAAMFTNITERKRAEEALRESEERYRSLVDRSLTGIYLTQNHVVRFCNQRFAEMFGYSNAEELTGKSVKELVSPESWQLVDEQVRLRESGEKETARYEFVGVKKDGSPINIEVLGGRITYQGKPAIQGSMIDITERKTAEETLQRRTRDLSILNKRFEFILGATRTNVDIIDSDFTVLYVDPQWQAIYGDYHGKKCFDYFMGQKKPCSTCGIPRAVETHETVVTEEVLPRENNRIIEVHTIPYQDADGRWLVAEFNIDITRRKLAEMKLSAEKEFSDNILNAAVDTIFIFDPKTGKPLRWNKAMNEMSGYTDEEIASKKAPYDWYDKEDLKLAEAATEKIFREGKGSVEMSLITKDGTRIPVEYSGSLVKDAQGEPKFIIAVGRDVTERKRAEEALAESEEKFRTLAEESPNMIFIYGKGRVLYTNKKSMEVMGYAREDFYSPDFNLMNIIAPESRELVTENLERHMRDEEVEPYEYTLVSRQGVRIYAILTTKLIQYEGSSAILGISTDITHRKQIEEAIRESEERYKRIFEESPISLWEEDLSGVKAYIDQLKARGVVNFREYFEKHPEEVARWSKLEKIIEVNRATLSLYEAKNKKELLGGLERILCEESQPALKEQLIALAEGKTSLQSESVNMTLKGAKKFVSLRLTVAPGYEESLSKVLISIVDITKRKRAEEALRGSQLKLAEAYQMLQLAFDTIPVRIFWKDRNSVYMGCNQLFAQDAGCEKPADLLGHDDYEMGWREQAGLYRKDDAEVMSTGVPKINYEEPQTTPDGRIIWLKTSKVPLKDLEGNIIGVLGTYEDVTERKRAEEALRESEEKFRNLYQTALVGLFRTSIEQGEVLAANETAARIFGYTDVEEFKRDFVTREHYKDPEKRKELFDILKRNGQVDNFEVEAIRKDGSCICIALNERLFTDEGYTEGSIVDITERKRAEEALRASEELYRLLAENSTDVIWTTDMEQRFTYISPSVSNILGYNAAEAMGLSLPELLTPASLERAMAVLAEEMDLEGTVERDTSRGRIMELELNRKDGSTVITETTTTFLRGADGKAFAILGVTRDIAERKQAEEALRQSEEFNRAVVENLPLGVSVRTTTGKLVSVNESWRKIWAFTDEEIEKDMTRQRTRLEFNEHDLYIKEWWDEVRKVYEEGGRLFIPEARIPNPRKGAATWVSQFFYALEDPQHEVESVVILTQDITERKQAEEALRESEEKYRQLVERAQDGIAIIQDYHLLYVNQSMARIVGYTVEEMAGTPFWLYIDPDELGKIQNNYERRMRGEDVPAVYETALLSKTGKKVYVELNIGLTPFRGKPAELVFVRDVTERRHIQEQLIRTSKLASLGVLASGIAHQVNNPLATMLFAATAIRDLMKKQSLAPAVRPKMEYFIATLEKQVDRTRKVVSDLLSFAQTKRSQVIPTDINMIVRKALDFICEHISLEKVELKLTLEDGLSNALVDPVALEEVLVNLLQNAYEAMSGQGRLELSTGMHEPGTITIKVSDNGPGVPNELKEEIFEPLYTTKSAEKGTGLGLPVSALLLERFDGRIWVEDTPGGGATFVIQVPQNKGGGR